MRNTPCNNILIVENGSRLKTKPRDHFHLLLSSAVSDIDGQKSPWKTPNLGLTLSLLSFIVRIGGCEISGVKWGDPCSIPNRAHQQFVAKHRMCVKSHSSWSTKTIWCARQVGDNGSFLRTPRTIFISVQVVKARCNSWWPWIGPLRVMMRGYNNPIIPGRAVKWR